MTLFPTPHLCVATARNATIRVECDNAKYHLPQSVQWRLASDGRVISEGESDRTVFTLHDLSPDTAYELEIDGAADSLSFRTRACAGLADISKFGASRNNPDNARSIAAAIAATPPGGTVLVPAGVWRTGPVFLRGGVTLHLAEGAVLQAISDRDAIAILPSHHPDGRPLGSWEGLPEACYAALVTAIDSHDITITGAGTLDGGGSDGDWWQWPKETRNGARRARTVFLSGCRNVVLSGVSIGNSPSWTVHPIYCRNVVACDLSIFNPSDSPNTDGFDPESCEDVLIEGVSLSVGDDCIAIKAGKRGDALRGDAHLAPTRQVTIRHCRMERGHGGVVIGSEMSGSVTDVDTHGCEFVDTDRGLRIKTRRGRGGEVARISMRDCTMVGVDTAFSANSFYFCDPDGRSDRVQSREPAPVDHTTPRIGDITILATAVRDLRVAAGSFLGLPEAPIRGVWICDLDVEFDDSTIGDVPEMACHLPVLLHAGIVSSFADVTVTGETNPQSLLQTQGVPAAC